MQSKSFGLMSVISLRQKFVKKWAYSGFFKQREKCFKYLFPLVDLHRKGQGDSSFIKYFINHEKAPYSNLEISDIICGFVLASLTNTTNLVTSTLVHLMKYPQYYDRVRTEVRAAPVEKGEIIFRGNIPILDAFVHETARFGASVQGSMRLCLKDYDICSNDQVLYTAPPGSLLMMSHIFKNFNPNVFADPNEFNPERFLEPRKERKSEVSNWGGGIHLCPGKNLALEEAKIISATIIRNYDIKAQDVGKYGTILNCCTGAAMSPISGNNYIVISTRTD
jgi:cytochrome P450